MGSPENILVSYSCARLLHIIRLILGFNFKRIDELKNYKASLNFEDRTLEININEKLLEKESEGEFGIGGPKPIDTGSIFEKKLEGLIPEGTDLRTDAEKEADSDHGSWGGKRKRKELASYDEDDWEEDEDEEWDEEDTEGGAWVARACATPTRYCG